MKDFPRGAVDLQLDHVVAACQAQLDLHRLHVFHPRRAAHHGVQLRIRCKQRDGSL